MLSTTARKKFNEQFDSKLRDDKLKEFDKRRSAQLEKRTNKIQNATVKEIVKFEA